MYQRIVIKLGTSVLTSGTTFLDRAHMVELARQCAKLQSQGHDVILCSSAAIAAGRARIGALAQPETIAHKQMLAAVGQSRLMGTWEHLFDLYDIKVGQMLLTRADMRDRRRYLNARDTLLTLLEHYIIPIINENDAVATAEIKVGDNDNLSALVALLAEADLLLLLTDQPGLFTADPRSHPDAELIPEVHTIDAALHARAGDSVSGLGTGGMTTKLQAADVARRAGADVIIAAGHAPNVILRAVAGEAIGTRFPALQSPLEQRKQWIFAGSTPSGSLTIDTGAADAIRTRGSSLLAAGITAYSGTFERGDTVLVLDPSGTEVARGLTRYDHTALHQISGCRSDAIEPCLGYTYGPAIIHRNDLILV